MHPSEIEVSRRAERDLRRIGRGPELDRISSAMRELVTGDANLDVRALQGASPWLRLRVGDWRMLYRPIARGFWIERVVHRRELERAIQTL